MKNKIPKIEITEIKKGELEIKGLEELAKFLGKDNKPKIFIDNVETDFEELLSEMLEKSKGTN
jgi:hypothetical protein